MFTPELDTQILSSYFNLNREEFLESHSYLGIDMQQWIAIVDAAANAVSKLVSFPIQDGSAVVDKSNISGLQECVSALKTCMNGHTSWHRASLILIEYQFLAHFKWTGSTPQFVEYSGWGPCIFDLSEEQLAYYLWWREQAKNGEFAQANGEYIWLFIYECLLNTTGMASIETRNLLERLYDYYSATYPKPRHKRLSSEKLGLLIVNYSLFNNLSDDIERLIQTYGIDDNYRKFHSFSSGKYRDFSEELLSMATSDIKTKGFVGSEEETYVLNALPLVFENIASADSVLHGKLLHDLCGGLHDHALWDVYETPVLSTNIVRRIGAKQEHHSFIIDGNTYVYATGEDLAASSEIANNGYSWYYNDSGNNFHKKGMFYRSQYEGTNPTGRQVVTYIVRELQNKYRTAYGQRKLKGKEFPYSDYKESFDRSIQIVAIAAMQTLKIPENNRQSKYVPEFMVLGQSIQGPSRFCFARKLSSDQCALHRHIDNQDLESLVVDDNIEAIDDFAFSCCSNLEAVTGGFGLKTIGTGAFYSCTRLQTVVLQDGTQEIGSGAFLGCINLNEIYIPSSVYQIGSCWTDDKVFDGSPTILCERGSYAEQYAKSHNIEYRIA